VSAERPRRVLVTRAASGIGLETALQLAQRDDHVTGFGQMGGPPGLVKPKRHAVDATVAARLWERSGQLTGVRYEAM
jgi:NAD(P)-dependent dehydrogenase (short-subunit alcohol dehydrogenase family)